MLNNNFTKNTRDCILKILKTMNHGSNDENNVGENSDKTLENVNDHTVLDSVPIVGEHFNENEVYNDDDLKKFKRRLNFKRSKVDTTFDKKRSPIRRPKDGTPLHQVFTNIMNKDSCSSFLFDEEENVDNREYPKWQVNHLKLLEDIANPLTSDTLKETSKISHKTKVLDKTSPKSNIIELIKYKESLVCNDTNNCQKFNESMNTKKPNQMAAEKANKTVKRPIIIKHPVTTDDNSSSKKQGKKPKALKRKIITRKDLN